MNKNTCMLNLKQTVGFNFTGKTLFDAPYMISVKLKQNKRTLMGLKYSPEMI